MSELRVYLRRDSLLEGTDCPWALLDDGGQLKSSGSQLADLPRARRCRLVLAADLVLGVKVPLPDLPERRLAPLLTAAVEAETLLEPDSIHAVLMERAADGEAVLAVIDGAWLKRVLGRLAALGLHPDSALPEYLLLPWTEGQWSVGWRSGGLIVRFGRCEGMVLDEGEPPVGLVLALTGRGRPEAVTVHVADNAGAPDWERWREVLATRVEAAGAWDWRSVPWPQLPGLLQGRHAPGLKRVDWARLARPAAWGLASLAAIQVVGVNLDWAMLARERAAIQKEQRVLAERSLPANAAIVDPPLQVAERLRGLQAATGNPSPDSLVGLLGRLSQAWPSAGNINVRTLNYEGGALSATVAAADAAWIDQLKLAAGTQGLVVEAQAGSEGGAGIVLSVRSAGKESVDGR